MKDGEFVIENNVLVKYNGNSEKVIIPQGVIHLSKDAFDESIVKHLIIPESLEGFDDDLFTLCDELEHIEVEDKNAYFASQNGILFNKDYSVLYAYPQAKEGKEYFIPKSVKKVCSNAFYYNQNIENIYISENVYDLSGFVIGCTSLKNIEVSSNNTNFVLEDDILFNKTKTALICDFGIYGRNNIGLEYKVPESVIYIDEKANFPQCIKSVWVHKDVKSLCATNFSIANIGNISNFESINVDKDNTNYSSIDGVLFDKKAERLLCYPLLKKALTYKVPPFVKSIDDYGIAYSIYLEFLDLSNVNTIKALSVFALESLKAFSVDEDNPTFAVKDGVLFNKDFTVLYRYPANKECEEYIVPESVSMIWANAFYECNNLKKLIVKNKDIIFNELAVSFCDFEIVVGEGNDADNSDFDENDEIPEYDIEEYAEELAEKLLSNAAEHIEEIKFAKDDALLMNYLINSDNNLPTVIALARNGDLHAQFEIESRLTPNFDDLYFKRNFNETLKAQIHKTIYNVFNQNTPFDTHMKSVAEYIVGNKTECYRLINENFDQVYLPSIFDYGKYEYIANLNSKNDCVIDVEKAIGFAHATALNGYGPAIAFDVYMCDYLNRGFVPITGIDTSNITIKKYLKVLGDENEAAVPMTNYAGYMGSQYSLIGGDSNEAKVEKFCRNLNVMADKIIPIGEALYNYAEFLEVNHKYAHKKVITLYEKSAELGCVKAYLDLGNIYYGKSPISEMVCFTDDDKKKSILYYEKAAKNNTEEAQTILGKEYWLGKIVNKDYDKSIYWSEKAIENGSIEALYYLGAAYFDSDTGKTDYTKAVKYFELSANKGNKLAMCMLGRCYFYGFGADKNYDEAKHWLEKSRNLGCTAAKGTLRKIKSEEKKIKKEAVHQNTFPKENIASQKPVKKPTTEKVHLTTDKNGNMVKNNIYHKKDKNIAAILAILLGGFGAHQFYMKKYFKGIVCILLSWTYIPAVIGVVQGIIYLAQSPEKFNMRCKTNKTNDILVKSESGKTCSKCGKPLNAIEKCNFCDYK